MSIIDLPSQPFSVISLFFSQMSFPCSTESRAAMNRNRQPTTLPKPLRASPSFISRQTGKGTAHFYLNLSPAPSLDLCVVCGGRERALKSYLVDRPTFMFPTIEFVADGEGQAVINGRVQQLRPGTAFAYLPGMAHRLTTSHQHPLSKYFVSFGGLSALKLLASRGLTAGEVFRVKNPAGVTDLFELLLHNGRAATAYSPDICLHLLYAIVAKLAEQHISGDSPDAAALEKFLQVRELLTKEAVKLRTIEDAAQRTGISPEHLSRLFQRFDHQTPYQFLTRQKMIYAAELLLSKRTLVRDVAHQLEFADQFHFSKVFKRILGLAPSEFVARHQLEVVPTLVESDGGPSS
jgi:AraC-like DNA-binding protein